MKRVATLLAASLCACSGSDNSTMKDAAVADAKVVDAPPQMGTLKVTTVRDGAVVPNTPVVFRDATGMVTATVMSDAQGVAQATVGANASFSVLFAIEGRPVDAVTINGVGPGESYETDTVVPPETNRTIVLPPALAGSPIEYTVTSSCSRGTAYASSRTTTLDLTSSCTTADFFVSVRNTQDSAAFGSVLVKNVTIPAMGNVDLSNNTYAPNVQRTITLTNTPAAIQSLQSQLNAFQSAMRLRVNNSGLQVGRMNDTPIPASVMGNAPMPAEPNVTYVAQTFMSRVAGNGVGGQIVFEGLAPGNYQLDVGAALAPVPAFATAPTYTAATKQFAWTETGAGDALDGVIMKVRIAAEGGMRHKIIAKHVGTSLTLPTFAAPYEMFNIPATGVNTFVENAIVFDSSAGYLATLPSIVGDSEPRLTTGQRIVASQGVLDN